MQHCGRCLRILGAQIAKSQRLKSQQNSRDQKSQGAGEIAMREGITAKIAVMRIAAISNRKRLGFQIASDLGI